MPRKSKKLVIDLDQKTGMLIGALVQKGLVKLEHNNGLDFGETKLELTTDPDDKEVILHANLNLARAYGFPAASQDDDKSAAK